MLAVGWVLKWFNVGFLSLLLFVLIFTIIFVLIWVLTYLVIRSDIKKINSKLKEKQN